MILNGGTDAGSMVAFDPEALPDDYDATSKGDPIHIITRLHKEGRVSWLDPQADGSYRLDVFTGETLPARLLPYVSEQEEISQFQTPSGRLYFTGIEYVFRHDNAYLQKHPHMGTAMEVPRGMHPAIIYTFSYPEEFEEEILLKHLGPQKVKSRKLAARSSMLGVLAFIGLIVSFFLLPLMTWAASALPVGLILIAVPMAMSRTAAHKSAQTEVEKIMDEYPDYALLLLPMQD